MTRRDRIRRLELQHLVRLAETVGAPYGLSVEAVFAEARRVFALPEAAQRAYFGDLYGRLTEQEACELDTIRARHGRILRGR